MKSDLFKIEIEAGDDGVPARLRLLCNPMPIYFAFKYSDLLPARKLQRHQVREMIHEYLNWMARELEAAIPSDYK